MELPTIVDGGTLKDMIENGDDVTRVCTSRLTNMMVYSIMSFQSRYIILGC